MSYTYGKYLDRSGGKFVQKEAINTSAGAGDAGKLIKTNSQGDVDETFLPDGIGIDSVTVTAAGGLAEGDIVNIYNDEGTIKARKADAGTNKYIAHGYCPEAILDAAEGTVYLTGSIITTGLTVGNYYLSDTPGSKSTAPPTGTGKIDQVIGWAVSTTKLRFEPQEEIELA